jgi:pSer/pThr/pTyr-binding forkhead associated (FHA) protein
VYKLLQIVEGNVVSEHPLGRGLFRIGRNPGNQLQPDEPSVSGNHAVLNVTSSAYAVDMLDVTVEDLGSTNGTRVNGKRVTRQRLKHGDILSLGALVLKFIDGQALGLDGTRILLQEDLA